MVNIINSICHRRIVSCIKTTLVILLAPQHHPYHFVESPKSFEFPVDCNCYISIYYLCWSSILQQIDHSVSMLQRNPNLAIIDKSPKSCALPVDAIVMYSIVLTFTWRLSTTKLPLVEMLLQSKST